MHYNRIYAPSNLYGFLVVIVTVINLLYIVLYYSVCVCVCVCAPLNISSPLLRAETKNQPIFSMSLTVHVFVYLYFNMLTCGGIKMTNRELFFLVESFGLIFSESN